MQHGGTKDDFLEQIRSAREEWESALADVGLERMELPGVSGTWAVRDIIAHTAYGQRWLVGQLRAERLGEPPTPHACYGEALPPQGVDMADDDARNAWFVQSASGRDTQAVLSDATFWADQLREEVSARSEDDLNASYTIDDLAQVGRPRKATDADAETFPLWGLIAGYTYGHDPEHTAEIRAWLEAGE